jgi:ATP-dependent DNA helicase RecG
MDRNRLIMNISPDQLSSLLKEKEDEHLEFKEAKQNFHFGKLTKYCAALANEGGGLIILGVTDKHPRRIVGTAVFQDLERTKAGLVERMRLRIAAEEIQHPDGRIVIFSIPSHPLGIPISVEGAYWMRAGQDLLPMTPDMLRRILDETGPDFSAQICPKATFSDIDHKAVEIFQRHWFKKTGNQAILTVASEQLLRDAELITEEGITYAALILLGTHAALGKHLANAEVVFEYKSSDASGPANQRNEFREGFLNFFDRLWELINLRNDKQHYQDGLFMFEIPTFNESAIREAVLNAIAHRDYRLAGSVFIRQFPRRIEIVSPGGFPQGITVENILDRQLPRNRRVAEALAKCGFVERAGQGANRIFESCIRESKPLPDFSNTDDWQVSLTLHGQVQDPRFIKFLERIGQEIQTSFDTYDFLIMESIHREKPIAETLKPRLSRLIELGVLESIGRGRGARYLLSRRFYMTLGKSGEYTRRKGLDRATNKALLLKHIKSIYPNGCALEEFVQVLPGVSRRFIQNLLQELRDEGIISMTGKRRWSRWHLNPGNEKVPRGL